MLQICSIYILTSSDILLLLLKLALILLYFIYLHPFKINKLYQSNTVSFLILALEHITSFFFSESKLFRVLECTH